MLPDWVSNPGPLTYESGALPTALRGPATVSGKQLYIERIFITLFLFSVHSIKITCFLPQKYLSVC